MTTVTKEIIVYTKRVQKNVTLRTSLKLRCLGLEKTSIIIQKTKSIISFTGTCVIWILLGNLMAVTSTWGIQFINKTFIKYEKKKEKHTQHCSRLKRQQKHWQYLIIWLTASVYEIIVEIKIWKKQKSLACFTNSITVTSMRGSLSQNIKKRWTDRKMHQHRLNIFKLNCDTILTKGIPSMVNCINLGLKWF